MLALILSANISKYLGSGPFFPSNGFESQENCATYWWTNFLYVNNFIDSQKMVLKPSKFQFFLECILKGFYIFKCFSISWFLANDMQFHWVAPLVLIPFAFK